MTGSQIKAFGERSTWGLEFRDVETSTSYQPPPLKKQAQYSIVKGITNTDYELVRLGHRLFRGGDW